MTEAEVFRSAIELVRKRLYIHHLNAERLTKEKRRAQADIDSGDYSPEKIAQLKDSVRKIDREIREEKHVARERVEEILEDFAVKLEADNRLKPSLLNEDAELLKMPELLTEQDYRDIIGRNLENTTMMQLAIRQADAQGFDLASLGNQSKYRRNIELARNLRNMQPSARYYAEWIDSKDFDRQINEALPLEV